MQFVLQMGQLLDLALHQARHRHPGPARHHRGDILFVHLFFNQPFAAGLLEQRFLFFGKLFLQAGQFAVLELGQPIEVVFTARLFDLLFGLFDLSLDLRQTFQALLFLAPLSLQRVVTFADFSQLFLQTHQAVLGGRIGLALERLAFDLELHDAPVDFVQLGRHRFLFGAQLGGRLIDQIDCLVGQETVRDVALGKTAAVTRAASLMRIP